MATIVREFPYAVREISHTEIVLHDGTRLAARMWLPQTATPVPAILEYLPYRKGDGTAIDDPTRHRYFAGHGFASIRVDMRGSGDSDGILMDEYTREELGDGVEVIAWLAAQPWCNGSVGMLGLSWGGFNSLQIAALAPPALKAIVTLCSTDDRYADDVHYMGGAVLAREMLGWAMTFLGFNAKPPDPQTIGERWRASWQKRLDETPPFVDRWLEHSQRDAYWKHGSVCENYAAIHCAVLAVGGWADGYTNTVMRLLDGLDAPCRGIIGPWAHNYPYAGRPGPAIGMLQEAVRWWDQWLNGRERGVLETPKLRVFIEDRAEPRAKVATGRWLGSALDPHEFERRDWYFGDGALQARPGERAFIGLPNDPRHGRAAGLWCPFGPGDLAADQRLDDAVSLTFDTAPLDADLTLLGRPHLDVECDAVVGAQIVARLTEVAPDGSSSLLSWGVREVDTAGVQNARVTLKVVGRRVRAGHRLRLALAASYWPMVWPAAVASPTIVAGTGRLTLPVWGGPYVPVAFEPPEFAEPASFAVLKKGALETFAGGAGRRLDQGRVRHANGIETETVFSDLMTLEGGTPTIRCERDFELARDGWRTTIAVRGTMTSDATTFAIDVALAATLNGEPCADRTWRFRIPRRNA
jgi:putative CocE/NonD family hydrolase